MAKTLTFLVTGLNVGGAEVQVCLLAQTMAQRGWLVHVISLIEPENFTDQLAAAGVTVHSLGMTPGRASIGALMRCVKLIKKIRPSVVHAHMYHANILARVVTKIVSTVPLICTAHNVDETEGSKARYWLYRLTKRWAQINTNVSQKAFEHYVGLKLISTEAGKYVPNGILPNVVSCDRPKVLAEFGINRNTFVWLAAGRLVPAKDFSNLISAAKILAEGRLDFRILIAGEGPLFEALGTEITNANLNETVKLIGLRRDLNRLMSASDALVMSSAWEGLPMVLLEALTLGRPIVATDVGGVGELVGPKSGGILVPPKDAPSLAAAMTTLMCEPSENLSHRADLALHASESYHINYVADIWEGLYLDVIHAKRS